MPASTVERVGDRQLISSGSPLEAVVGYSRAVRVGDRVFVAGTAAQWPDAQVDPDPETQTRRCLDIIAAALTEAGATLADVVRTRVYLVDGADFEAMGRVHGECFRDVRPANTTVVVKALLNPEWKVEIEVEAVLAHRA
jgi:enamine deaminase RidA (YjgF/YER057c/UK114 family)